MNAHDLIKEAIAEKGKFDSVYWIACGGSMIDLIPAHELLQREATTFTSYIYTAREFDIMRPRRLGEKSQVIACSHSGNTPAGAPPRRQSSTARERGFTSSTACPPIYVRFVFFVCFFNVRKFPYF